MSSDLWFFLGIGCLALLVGLAIGKAIHSDEENKIVFSSVCVDGYRYYINVDTPRYNSYAICPVFENTPDGIRIKTCGE